MRHLFISGGLLATIALYAACALPARADAGSDLQTALENTFQQSSYHLTVTSGKGDVVEGDFVMPDRMHMVMKMGEMIVIGQTTYMKLNGAWRKFPGTGPMPTRVNLLQRLNANKGKYTVEDLGMKMVGGVPLHAYRSTDLETKKTMTAYVDSHHRIVRMEDSETVMQITRFGESVTIAAPM